MSHRNIRRIVIIIRANVAPPSTPCIVMGALLKGSYKAPGFFVRLKTPNWGARGAFIALPGASMVMIGGLKPQIVILIPKGHDDTKHKQCHSLCVTCFLNTDLIVNVIAGPRLVQKSRGPILGACAAAYKRGPGAKSSSGN